MNDDEPVQLAAKRRGTGPSDMESALALKLDERMSPSDVRVLETCWGQRQIDSIDSPDAGQIVWLLHYKLLTTWVDTRDTVWLETTQLGRNLMRLYKEQRAAGRVAGGRR